MTPMMSMENGWLIWLFLERIRIRCREAHVFLDRAQPPGHRIEPFDAADDTAPHAGFLARQRPRIHTRLVDGMGNEGSTPDHDVIAQGHVAGDAGPAANDAAL